MSDHDFDLITELINGHLTPDERRAALARVAADPELQSEYETQLAVSSLLSEIPAPTMTAAERSELRTALRRQLNLEDTPAPVVVPPSSWRRWWAPVTGLAAAAAVIIGVVVVLPEADPDDSLQFAAAEVETTIQASRNDGADPEGASGSADGADDGSTTATAPASEELASADTAEDTTDGSVEASGEPSPAAADEPSPAAADEPSPKTLPYLPEIDLGELSRAYSEGPDEFEDELTRSSVTSEPATTLDTGACLDQIEGEANEASFTMVATATIDGSEVVVFVVTPLSEDPYLIALDARTCEELASTRP
jgi:anti-sigma factor RsiW